MRATPYFVGITGHRDLEPNAIVDVQSQIKEFLSYIDSNLPNTPLVALSGMADGADRIFAKVALELGIAVKAILPLPELEYARDFSEQSYQEFCELCAHENVTIEVVEQIHKVPLGQPIGGEDRDNQYWVLGQYLTNHCNLLFTVWDGENTGLTGGTSDVLLDYLDAKPRRKHDRNPIQTSKIKIIEQAHDGEIIDRIVCWIPVDKSSDGHCVNDKQRLCFLSGTDSKYTFLKHQRPPESLLEDWSQFDEYNEKIISLESENLINREYNLLNGYQVNNSPIPAQFLEQLDEEFLKADAVAVVNQKYSDGQFAKFSIMAALMGFFFLIYAKIVASSILLTGYLLMFLWGLYYFKKIEKSHSFTNHLTARALAETLRTEFYLTLIGRGSNTKPTHLLKRCGVGKFSGFNWIKNVILAYVPVCLDKSKYERSREYNVEFVCKYWIEDQVNYFDKKSKQLASNHHKLEHIKSFLFVGSAIMALALILFKYQLVEITIYGSVNAKVLTVLLMGLLPFLLGIWEIYQNKMAVKELLWQYRNQRELFNNALKQINHAATLEQKHSIIHDLADKALLENYIWIIHRYHREHEPPTAG